MELAYYKNNVQAAKDALIDAECRLRKARHIEALLLAEGLILPDPLDTSTRPGEGVRFFWRLEVDLGLNRFVGCGCVHIIYWDNDLICWSWESSRRTRTPDWVEAVDGRTVTSYTPPPEFVAFVKKYSELMFMPSDQRKRALQESP